MYYKQKTYENISWKKIFLLMFNKNNSSTKIKMAENSYSRVQSENIPICIFYL